MPNLPPTDRADRLGRLDRMFQGHFPTVCAGALGKPANRGRKAHLHVFTDLTFLGTASGDSYKVAQLRSIGFVA
ncbi:MAG: hypothetical protein JWN95_58 [Frankiales bacterium]|nr:hypothetical protein [Frankiales bacterium]